VTGQTQPTQIGMTGRPGELTSTGQRSLQDCSAGEWRTVDSCPVKFIVDDHLARAGVLWAPRAASGRAASGNPVRRLMADLQCDRRLGSAMTRRGLYAGRLFVRAPVSLALLMSLLGAKLGATAGRHRATSGHIGPESWQLNGTPGDSWPCLATGPACMACKRSRVRIP
jgi:hypothetical protein